MSTSDMPDPKKADVKGKWPVRDRAADMMNSTWVKGSGWSSARTAELKDKKK